MNDYINYYDLLGVSKSSSKEEIKKAYIKQVKKWHPDINKENNAADITKKLNEAKEVLLDDNKRAEYDKVLDNKANKNYNDLKSKIHNNKNKETNNSYNSINKEEEKLYTKWEYFKLYLKYYKVSIIRKLFAILLVSIETIICLILQIINYLISYVLITFYDLIRDGLILGLVVYIGYGLVNYFRFNELFTLNDYIIPVLLLLIIISLSNIIGFLINNVSYWISKLNVFLFKLSIGYYRK